MRGWWLVLASCVPVTERDTGPADDSGTTRMDDTVPSADDTERPDDSGPAQPDDSAPLHDTAATGGSGPRADDTAGPSGDTVAPAPTPPSFSGAMVDLAVPALTAQPMWVGAGDRTQRKSPSATAGQFVDLDGDGDDEVVFTTQKVTFTSSPVTLVQVFHWAPGGLVHDAALSATFQAWEDHVSGVGDLDGDGAAEVILSRPDREWVGASTPGAWHPPRPLPLDDGYPFDVYGGFGAVAPYDVDQDGWLDLLVGDRSCQPGTGAWRLFLFDGAGWRDATHLLEEDRNGRPWAVLAAAHANGSPVLGNIGGDCGQADPQDGFLQVVGTDADGFPRFGPFNPAPPNAYFRQITSVANGPITSTNPMGAALFDADGDGRLDFTTTLDSDTNPLFLHWGDWPMAEATWFGTTPFPTNGMPMFAFGVVAIDLDLDGRPDQILAHGDEPGTFYADSIGPQIARAVWNDGQLGWVDVDVGVAEQGSWRAAIAGDPDRDGDLDVLVGGFGSWPRLYRNDLDVGHHGLTVDLVGTASNALGIGATIELVDADVPDQIVQHGASWSPTAWSPPVSAFGLGAEPTADMVRVTWPSGVVTEHPNLAGGARHTLVEPDVLHVAPATRHLPADGSSTATITVQPTTRAGVPDPAVPVTIELAHGAATWAGPAVQDGATWTRTLVAPAAPSSAVVTVTLDGTPLLVRPRVWFDVP